MAAQAAAAIPLCFDPHGSDQAIHLELCVVLTAKEEPSKCPQELVIMTPAHLTPSSRCCRGITRVTAFLQDTATASNPQGNLVSYFAFFSHPTSGMILVSVQTGAWLTSFLERFPECNNAHGRGG